MSRLQDTLQNLHQVNDRFDLLSGGELTEDQADRHGLFAEHAPMTVDWEVFSSTETLVCPIFDFSNMNFSHRKTSD